MPNPYTPSANPQTSTRGISSLIRNEFVAIQTAFATLIAGQTWGGTHDFTGATIRVATQAVMDNSTKAASTAMVQSVAMRTALPAISSTTVGMVPSNDGMIGFWANPFKKYEIERGIRRARQLTFA
ncbi:hypothetical protein GALL_153380 [mine drainage metagenome]|uniref:Uncharacterized protein n=1 Tax=mine drainage metagenome TaxID=410659 RepID=A0A1J5SF04_9ZZZZ